MRKMKIGVFLILALFTTSILSAQDLPKKQMANIEAQTKKVAEAIGLSADEEKKFLEINIETAKKQKEINKKFEKGSEEFKAANKELWPNKRKAVEESFSKENYKKWLAYLNEQKKNKEE